MLMLTNMIGLILLDCLYYENIILAFVQVNILSVPYHLMYEGQKIGGAMIRINTITHHNALDFFFINPEWHSKGLGLAAWQAIEQHYPQTKVWTTVTPYFEQRNIHFYVNKCGFHIVEFFNQYHPDPNMPPSHLEQGGPDIGEEAFFKFEKVMA